MEKTFVYLDLNFTVLVPLESNIHQYFFYYVLVLVIWDLAQIGQYYTLSLVSGGPILQT